MTVLQVVDSQPKWERISPDFSLTPRYGSAITANSTHVTVLGGLTEDGTYPNPLYLDLS